MKVGYARVSTKDQNLDRQINILKKIGIDERSIFKEKYSGSLKSRPEFDRLMKFLKENDELYITSLDRLSRSHMDLLNTIQLLKEKKVYLKSLEEKLDFSTPSGELMVGMFSLLHQFNRKVMVENIKAGFKAGKLKGKKYGRPSKLNEYEIDSIMKKIKEGKEISVIANELNVCRLTVYNYIKKREEKEIETMRKNLGD